MCIFGTCFAVPVFTDTDHVLIIYFSVCFGSRILSCSSCRVLNGHWREFTLSAFRALLLLDGVVLDGSQDSILCKHCTQEKQTGMQAYVNTVMVCVVYVSP